MDVRRLQGLAGKQACEARGSSSQGRPTLGGFDDDSDWSDDPPADDSASIISTAGAELRRTTEMEVVTVSPLVRSIFEGRKKAILDAGYRGVSKKADVAGGGAQVLAKQVPQRDRAGHVGEELEKTTALNKKVQALDEEIAIFKKESKRMKNLAKEHEEGLTKLAREKAEWEQQKKSQMQAFQAQQEEQMEKLRKEKQILDHRAVTVNILPAIQRKDVEELKGTLAKEQEEHRRKEMRLRLTINRLRAMNEDLTKQVLELQEEIRRYEGCVLSALDNKGNGLQAITSFSKNPCSEANHKHSCTSPKQPPPQALRGGSSKSSRQSHTEESYDLAGLSTIDEAEQICRTESTPNFFSEQAKFLSDLFSQPWKIANCAAKENTQINRHHMGPKLAADWT